MSQIGSTELLLILLVVLVLFGAKRLPDLSRSIGRSARILKSETRGLREDPSAADDEAAAAPSPVVAVPVSDLSRTNRDKDVA